MKAKIKETGKIINIEKNPELDIFPYINYDTGDKLLEEEIEFISDDISDKHKQNKNVIIEIDGVKHQLVEGTKNSYPCDLCSLSYLCDDCSNSCPTGLCVDIFKGGRTSYFKKLI